MGKQKAKREKGVQERREARSARNTLRKEQKRKTSVFGRVRQALGINKTEFRKAVHTGRDLAYHGGWRMAGNCLAEDGDCPHVWFEGRLGAALPIELTI